MLESLYFMLHSLEMSFDPFSDILRLANPQSVVSGDFTAGGDWAVEFAPKDRIKFLAVTKGWCWLRVYNQEEPLRFEAGDLLLFSQYPVTLASRLDVPVVDGDTLEPAVKASSKTLGIGEDFTLLGGYIQLEPSNIDVMADILPPVLHIPSSVQDTEDFRWLVRQLIEEKESGLPGQNLAANHIAQLIFIHVLRLQLQKPDIRNVSWLKAAVDIKLRPAIELMHNQPERSWTLQELARACSMSRASFSAYFKRQVGITPFAYLAQWRMRLAGQALRSSHVTIALLAQQCGYQSESAFSNAFKAHMGMSPRYYRNGKP